VASIGGPPPLTTLRLPVEPLHPGAFAAPPGTEGDALLRAGDSDAAGAAFRRCGATHEAAVGLAAALGTRGRYAEALAVLERAGEAPDDAALALELANRAAALTGAGELAGAERVAREALRAARRSGDGHRVGLAGLALALAHLSRGRAAPARARLGDAARAFAATGDVPRQVQCHHLLGEIAYGGEDPIRAGSHYRDALALARSAGMQSAIEHLTLLFEHR
jgi:tetratricopeptide (TPR) repeat protein